MLRSISKSRSGSQYRSRSRSKSYSLLTSLSKSRSRSMYYAAFRGGKFLEPHTRGTPFEYHGYAHDSLTAQEAVPAIASARIIVSWYMLRADANMSMTLVRNVGLATQVYACIPEYLAANTNGPTRYFGPVGPYSDIGGDIGFVATAAGGYHWAIGGIYVFEG